MNPTDPARLYADSPERMLYLSILLVVAITLLVLYNHMAGKKGGVQPAARPAQLPSMTKPDQTPLHWVGPEQHRRPS